MHECVVMHPLVMKMGAFLCSDPDQDYSDLKSLGSLSIKGTNELLCRVDLLVLVYASGSFRETTPLIYFAPVTNASFFKFLPQHPKFFSFGFFTHEGPTREQVLNGLGINCKV